METHTADYKLQFDGTNDYVNIDGVTSSFNNGDAFTISSWFKSDGTTESSSHQSIIFSMHTNSGDNIIRIGLDRRSSGTGIFYSDGSTSDRIIGSTNYNDQQWHHIVVTRSFGNGNRTGTFYIDGTSAGTLSNLDPSFSSASKASIGQEWDSYTATDFWGGYIGEDI